VQIFRNSPYAYPVTPLQLPYRHHQVVLGARYFDSFPQMSPDFLHSFRNRKEVVEKLAESMIGPVGKQRASCNGNRKFLGIGFSHRHPVAK
jgi:hypothetical protein